MKYTTIGGFGHVPISWHLPVSGGYGLSSRVADSGKRDAVPSGFCNRFGRAASVSPWSAKPKPMCETLWSRASQASSLYRARIGPYTSRASGDSPGPMARSRPVTRATNPTSCAVRNTMRHGSMSWQNTDMPKIRGAISIWA